MVEVFQTLIQNRRSIRAFTQEKVDKETQERLAQALLLAPSSRNRNPHSFLFVTDTNILKRLSGAKEHGSGFLANASLGVVVYADPQKSDVWIEDASIAAAYLLLAAETEGLGACWIQIRNRTASDGVSSEEKVRKICGLKDDTRVDSIIALGHPAEHPAAHNLPKGVDKRISYL
ncbi:MAG: nitroreductase family protein [Spirochaetia bacterium]